MEASEGALIMESGDMSVILGKVRSLYTFHAIELDGLMKAHLEYGCDLVDHLSTPLSELERVFFLYSDYVNAYESAVEMVKKRTQKGERFAQFVAMNEKLMGTSLLQLLKEPLDRFPEYLIQIGRIHKAMGDKVDCLELKPLGVSMRVVVESIKDIPRRYEMNKKLESISTLKAMFEASGQMKDIWSASDRLCLKYGLLSMQKESVMFALFNDRILIGSTIRTGLYSILHVLDSEKVKVASDGVNGLCLSGDALAGKQIILTAKHETERNEWLKAIEKAHLGVFELTRSRKNTDFDQLPIQNLEDEAVKAAKDVGWFFTKLKDFA